MQDVVSTRHLWLTKLRSLDLTCVPDFPPHTKVESLSYFELREIVVNAARLYSRRVKNSLKYEIKHTVTLDSPTPGIALSTVNRDILRDSFGGCVRLSPGSRYLFTFIMSCRGIDRPSESNILEITDLHHNSCVWTYAAPSIAHSHGLRVNAITDFGFEVCEDGTITLGIVGGNISGGKCVMLGEGGNAWPASDDECVTLIL